MIGLSADTVYMNQLFSIGKGDKILLFTDGLYEEFNSLDQEFGDEHIFNALEHFKTSQNIQSIINYLMNEVYIFMRNEPFNDDITIIGIEI